MLAKFVCSKDTNRAEDIERAEGIERAEDTGRAEEEKDTKYA